MTRREIVAAMHALEQRTDLTAIERAHLEAPLLYARLRLEAEERSARVVPVVMPRSPPSHE